MSTTNLENSQNLQKAMLQAIQAVSNKAVTNGKGTLTVEARIDEIVDEGTGVYNVEYLGNTFEATSVLGEFTYNVDDKVYVLVPEGNFDKNKVILSPININTATLANGAEDGDKYVSLGDSLFAAVEEVQLCTFRPEERHLIKVNNDNFVKLFNSALLDSRYFALKCRIKTDIESSRRAKGNYGIILNIPVIQDGESKTYTATLDINNITGDPYNLSTAALQTLYFYLPEDMTLDVDRASAADYNFLYAFVKNFPRGSAASNFYDIFITDLQLISTFVIGEDTMSGYYLSLVAEGGPSFLPSEDEVDTKRIIPNVYLNGKVTSIKNFDVYWFRENYLIDTASEGFSRYGGIGWEILNARTNVEIDETGKTTYQYNTRVYDQIVRQSDIRCATRYKCTIVRDNKEVSQTITLRNLAADVNFKLESSTGSNEYIQNVGTVKIKALYYENGLTNVTAPKTLVKYSWGRLDKNGNYIDNDFYTVLSLNDKVTINDKVYYQTEIEFDTSLIDGYNTINCTVSLITPQDDGTTRTLTAGSASLVISTGAVPAYRINIANADKLYKYDSDGDSPMVADYDGPTSSIIKTINPLEITIYKPDGTEFTEDEYKVTTLRWRVPVESMIVLNTTDRVNIIDGYYNIVGSYESRKSLSYTIASSYNKRKENTTIYVEAYFKGSSAENAEGFAEGVANLLFMKDGESGTNGSRYSAVITINSKNSEQAYGERNEHGVMNKLQLVYARDDSNQWHMYNPAEGKLSPVYNQFATLGIRLYSDGERVTDPSGSSNIEQSIFDKDYTYDNILSPITINPNTGNLSIDPKAYNQNSPSSTVYCATIQAKVRAQYTKGTDESSSNTEEYVYAYYPIEVTQVENLNYIIKDSIRNLRVIPSMDGGFDQVVYASDGTNPTYNNNREFTITDSLYNNDEGDIYDYSQDCSTNLKLTGSKTGSTGQIQPVTKFDNGVAKNYVKVALIRSQSKNIELQNKASAALGDANYYSAIVNYYKQLQSILDNNFFDNYKYDNYFQVIQDTSSLLKEKTNLHSSIKEALDNMNKALEALLTDIEQQQKIIDNPKSTNSKKNIAKNMKSKLQAMYDKYKNKPETLEALLSLINKIGGIDIFIVGTAITEILNTKDYKPNELLANAADIRTLRNSYKKTVIANYFQSYNTIINKYKEYYNNLDKNSISYMEQQVLVTQMVQEIQDFVDAKEWNSLTLHATYNSKEISFEEHKYVSLKETIQGTLNSMDAAEGVSLDSIQSNILDPIQLVLADYKNLSYNNIIEDYEKRKEAANGSYEDYTKMVTPAGDQSTAHIAHIKPVIMLYNRYEMSNINGWDGNKTQVEEGYILSPQMGAGKKEEGFFTGIVMGLRQVTVKDNNPKIGLFGYAKGVQSLFLNARDGSALFGKSGDGQIVIDPRAVDPDTGKSLGLLYNAAYFDDVGIDDTGKPKNYNSIGKLKEGKKGMLINLTAPYIHFADTTGKIYSGGHSSLASTKTGFYLSQDGLSISGEYLEDNVTKTSRIELNTNGNPKIYSGGHSSLASTKTGFYLGNDGLSIGSKVYINNEGILKLGLNATTGGARNQTINGTGTDNDGISYIAYNTSKFNDKGSSVYIGTDGISLAKDKFYVKNNGELTSKSGHIGGQQITGSELKSDGDKTILYSNGKIICENLEANSSGSIGGQKIGATTLTGGNTTLNSNGTITCENLIAKTSGDISGWAINANSLTNGTLTLGSGFISGTGFTLNASGLEVTNPSGGSSLNQGDNFSVSTEGTLKAKNAVIEGTITAYAGYIGGQTISTDGLYSDDNQIYPSGIKTKSLTATAITFTTTGDASITIAEFYDDVYTKIDTKVDKGVYTGTCDDQSVSVQVIIPAQTARGTATIDGKDGNCSVTVASQTITVNVPMGSVGCNIDLTE